MKYLTVILAVFAVLGAGCGGVESGAGAGTGTGIEVGEAEEMSSQLRPYCFQIGTPCTSHGQCCWHCYNGHCMF